MYIIGIHLLVKLQDAVSNKIKYLTDISQGIDKCTKATLQNKYFYRTPADDCFCLETWAPYHYNKKRRKFKTILIWRSSRKFNRNKNLLIPYYLWKKLLKFPNAQKKVFQVFLFKVPIKILNFLVMFHFMKLIASKLWQWV